MRVPARSPAPSPARRSAATAIPSSAACSARVVGGVVGNAVERGATRENAVEILVQLKNGERRSVIQGVGAETYAVGEPVVLVTTAGRTRVSRSPNGYAPAPAPGAYPAPSSGYPAPAGYPDAPVQPVYPSSGPVPPRS